jgi:hypothetical protein
MSEMKLIMESWNSYLAEAPQQIATVGHLRRAIQMIRAANAGGEIAKKAAGMIVDQIPVLNNVKSLWSGAKDVKDIVGKFYGADDKAKTGTGLDKLNVDDDISKIVDDPIEIAFLNWLINEKFAQAADEEPLDNFDATELLTQYIADKFNKRTVSTQGGA